MEQLLEKIARLPLIPLLIFWFGYLAYDYYGFTTDAESPLIMIQAEMKNVLDLNAKLQEKIKEVQQFQKNLEVTRVELRNTAQKLESFKSSITENLDQAEIISSLSTEAERVGLTIQAVTPLASVSKEYYSEHPFEFKLRGAFPQILFFVDRLSNLQKVVRVEDFELKPLSSDRAKIVELEATLQIKAYKYLGSKADELAKNQNKNKGAQ